MNDSNGRVRRAGPGDVDGLAALAAQMAQSFPFSADGFRQSYQSLAAAEGVCLLVADGEPELGYLLGFRHLTFYANGPVGWVEEVAVRYQHRGRGIGRAMMNAFEDWAVQ